MRTRMTLVLTTLLAAAFTASAQLESSQTLLERTVFYVSNGKTGQTKYWYIYMGAHDVKARRRFPGEDSVTLAATISYRLISSGYVSGSGMASNGKKIDALAGFLFATQDTSYKIPIDSIAYIFDNFNQVVLVDGKRGYLRIDAEGSAAVPNSLQLTAFKMVVEYGDKILRKEGEAIVQGIAFTKENAAKMVAEQKKLATEPAK
jgi:hypothetical protein